MYKKKLSILVGALPMVIGVKLLYKGLELDISLTDFLLVGVIAMLFVICGVLYWILEAFWDLRREDDD